MLFGTGFGGVGGQVPLDGGGVFPVVDVRVRARHVVSERPNGVLLPMSAAMIVSL